MADPIAPGRAGLSNARAIFADTKSCTSVSSLSHIEKNATFHIVSTMLNSDSPRKPHALSAGEGLCSN